MPCTTHAKYKSSITESWPRKLAGFHSSCLKLTLTQLYDASKLSKATLTCRFLDHVGQVPQPLAVVFHRRWLDKRLLRRRRVGTGKNELKAFIWWCLMLTLTGTKPRFYQPSKRKMSYGDWSTCHSATVMLSQGTIPLKAGNAHLNS